jgi:hypothetical protein
MLDGCHAWRRMLLCWLQRCLFVGVHAAAVLMIETTWLRAYEYVNPATLGLDLLISIGRVMMPLSVAMALTAMPTSGPPCSPPHYNPGCQVATSPCNASDVNQQWKYTNYSASSENSLALAAHHLGNPLCLNVARAARGQGADVWVTECAAEHPDHANRHWEFTEGPLLLKGKLRNTRSGLCALETPPRHSPEEPGYTVLSDCRTAPAWTMDADVGLIRSADDSSRCLSVDFETLQPGPTPPAPPAVFGDVRDRLGCQLRNHSHYPFCNTSKSIAERAADLVARIHDADKPGLLTARALQALPYLGVPAYYWGTNCLHSAITECAGQRCPTSFPAAPNWAATFDVHTMTAMAAVVGKELRECQPHSRDVCLAL